MAVNALSQAAQEVLAKMRELQSEAKNASVQAVQDKSTQKPSSGFIDHLRQSVDEVNQMQKTADRMSVEVSSGKSEALHETMLAVTQAELSFNLMVQIRNRALEAYQEVMRMPV